MPESQFDERYRLPPHHVENPGVAKRARFVESEQRRIQSEIKNRPENISWFEDLLARPLRENGRKLVGYFCNMIPSELVRALGAVPVRLGCGNPALVQPGEEVFSGEICPLAKASFAAFMDESSLTNKCAALLVPSSCDAKRKLGEVLADFRPTFMLNMPPEQDAARFGPFAAEEFGRMADFLCEQLGARLRTGDLVREIDLANRRTLLIRQLQTARASKLAALSVRDAFVVVQSSFTAVDLEDWLGQARKVLEHVERFDASRPRYRPRLVLTGAPVIWPNFKPLNLIEESGADVVADTLCSGAQAVFDPVVYAEKSRGALMRALAQRYVFGSPCPCFISQGTRLSRVLDLASELKADGVVNYSLRLCQLFDIEAYRLARVMKGRHIPFMIMRTDYSLEDTEQLRVRLEAFLETIDED
jgi:benzoyl-CoA reductase/2-hydroxyglutaryl-CoA dehydratase subunit BcrC/BadD/HgdB